MHPLVFPVVPEVYNIEQNHHLQIITGFGSFWFIITSDKN
jgi:hypothetical protein